MCEQERIDILSIHTKPWTAPPSMALIEEMAHRSTGYCGSDLRLLCSEAVIAAMRRRYPQVYRSSKKLLLQPDQVQVKTKTIFFFFFFLSRNLQKREFT